jgi:hypothetical protein
MILKKKPIVQKKYKPIKQPFVSLENGLLKSTDVKSISFKINSKGSKIILGAGVFGTVYLGQVTMVGNKTVKKRVAIKRFDSVFSKNLSDLKAQEYQQKIDQLRNIFLEPDNKYPNRSKKAKLFPKAAMVKIKINGKSEWVMISQAFYSKKKGSKLKDNFISEYSTIFKDTKLLEEYMQEFFWVRAKLIENGVYASDVVTNLNVVNSFVIDIDSLVNQPAIKSPFEKANVLYASINEFPIILPVIKKKAIKIILDLNLSKEVKSEFVKLIKTKNV